MKKKLSKKHTKQVTEKSFRIVPLLLWIVGCELIGIAGSIATVPQIPTWFASLSKPVFSPPNWVFGPVWTILYAMMGFAAYRIWNLGIKNARVRMSLGLFFVQLLLNSAWSFIFFAQQNIFGAFIEIIILWVSIMATMWQFEKLDKVAGYTMIPYFLWVSFAMILNYSLYVLNG